MSRFPVFLLMLAAAALAGELTVTIPFDAGQVQLSTEGVYTGVAVPGMPSISIEGLPCLPLVPVRVAIPTGCRATSMEVVDVSWTDLPGFYDVMPANEPVPISVEMDYVQALPDEHVYSRDAWFPGSPVTLRDSGVLWGIPMAYVSLYPVRWNPASRTLQIVDRVTVSLVYEQDPDVMLIDRRTAESEAEAMDIARRLVVNPEGVSSSGAVLVEPRDLTWGQYVIITAPEYEVQAQELADWKTAKGIPAAVYTSDWVQSQYSCANLQQEMRAFLTDCRDDGTDYVLLFGDDDKLECRDVKLVGSSSYSTIAPADLYFADINDTAPGADLWNANGNTVWGEVPYPYQYPQPAGYDQVDYHPDLWVGRASVNTASEASLFVDKVLIYEGIQSADYFETAPRELRIGYTTGILWSSPYIPGSADAESISTFVPGPDWEEEKCYESLGQNSAAITVAMIDAGPHHVFHASHGSQTYMWTSAGSNYTTAMIMAQTNIADGGLPALWQSISCLIGQLDGYECCADAWLASPDGGGFGCFNSREGWGNFAGPCTGPSEILCIFFYQYHWEYDLWRLGIAHGTSMDAFCPPCSIYADWAIKEYNLFGDPELPIWTEVPGDMTVTHPSSIAFAQTVTVTVTDGRAPIEGARVCLQKGPWQNGEVYEVALTNASGQANIFVDPATAGTIDVTVWNRNCHTYQGEIAVTGTGGGDVQSLVPCNRMSPVAPSPASSAAFIDFSLAAASHATLEVFDLSGRKVGVLVDGDLLQGPHSVIWDLTDSSGAPVPSGVYHMRLTAGGFVETSPVVVLR